MTPLCDLCRHSQNEFLRLPPVYQAEGTILLARVQALSFGLNALPAHCLPSWSVNVTQAVVQRAAMDIRRSEDHGNCAAIAMLLALLRPQMFASVSNVPVEWPPLRIFGVPPIPGHCCIGTSIHGQAMAQTTSEATLWRA